MNDSAEYFDSLKLHPGDSEQPESSDANEQRDDFLTVPRPEAENHQLASGLEAMLHGESLEHVVAEVGTACVTRSDVATAVHTAVNDAVQAAVNGVVAVAVAAAIKANSSMNTEEVETRFRQKFLGVGLPDVPGVDAPFLKAPRLQVEDDGSVALSPDALVDVVELADNDPTLFEKQIDLQAGDVDLFAALEFSEIDEISEVVENSAIEVISEIKEVLEAADSSEVADVTLQAIEQDQQAEKTVVFETKTALEPEHEAELEAAPEAPVETTAPVAVVPVVEPKPVAVPAPVVEPEPVAVPELAVEIPPVAEIVESELAAVPVLRPSMPNLAKEPESVERTLRHEKSIQFVGFQVGTQMYAVPSILIREVIRRQPLSRLPVQTRYAPGVINLRGQVIPVVSLRELLQADMPPEGSRNQFSIITGSENLRIALEVDKIRSMYVVKQADIVWNVSSVLGLDDETIIGLFELEERLVPILSVERVAAILLEEGLDLEVLSA